MASPLLELAEHCPEVEIEIVPGLTAALSGAAVLGAPLAHDFCVISLSDRLTPWAVIEKRLACAAAGISVWRSTTRRPGAAPTTCKGRSHSAGQRQGPGHGLRAGALHWPGRPDRKAADIGRTGGYRRGYVHNGLCRQRCNADFTGQNGDAQGYHGV